MAASPENFTLDSGHYENMPLNAELLEHFTQFARAVQKHDGTPAFSEQTLVELSKAGRGESLVKPQVFAFTPAADNSELQAVLVAVPSPADPPESRRAGRFPPVPVRTLRIGGAPCRRSPR